MCPRHDGATVHILTRYSPSCCRRKPDFAKALGTTTFPLDYAARVCYVVPERFRPRNEMEPTGLELLLDLYECQSTALDDAAALQLELAGRGGHVLGVDADGHQLRLGLDGVEREGHAEDHEEGREEHDHRQNSGFTSFLSQRPPAVIISPAAPSITWPRPEENIGLM